MAFGSGGFGGFGSNNNNNTTSTGFGGFGSSTNNNTGTGFGASTTNTGGGFGANNNAGSSIFGGSGNTAPTSGFGGGFGGNTSSTPAFGAKPAFGASTTSTGGGLFGGSTATSGGGGFGGFGGNNNTANATPAFGGGATTGANMFGNNTPKPGFGGAQGNSLFGNNNNTATTGGFGGNNNTTAGGFGANNNTGGFGGGPPAGAQNNTGTANTPFAAHIEKDSASSTNSHYQSITFQQPYQNYSFEELRLADYNQGRRYGTSNGQAGAFGQSNFGGGFGGNNATNTTTGFGGTAGNTGGGMFGGNNAAAPASSPFGATQPAAGGAFGGSGGLFGSKPAAGGLFGGTPASTTQSSGGLFGTATPATSGTGFGGFGGNTSTGGSLFGGANTSTQPKPAFGGFGASTTAAPSGGFGASTGTTGFGGNTAPAAGGLFGSAPAANATTGFGGAAQPQNSTGGGLFGGGGGGFGQNNTQQQQPSNPSGGGLFGGGGGAFGSNAQQNQPKPGLFGAAPAATSGGGLFGGNNQNQQQQSGGLFGGNNNNNQQQSGGLFGNQPKPAANLFGGSTPNNASTGGGLFGGLGNNNNTQQQQQQGGGLFGQSNQQAKPSLFGGMNASTNNNNNNNAAGNSLFGASNNNNGGSLFGQQNQQQQGGNFFGGSQQNQQGNQTQQLAATLMSNPYGNDQLFSGIGTPQPAVGPLATPLSGAQKPAKRPAALPAFKINPSASLRLITPQKRTNNGYGFSYATYGTPGSAQSFTSNGLGSSLLQSGGLGRSLGKSFSTTNLRSTFNAEDSVLAPGAFTPNSRPYAGGSIRRLKIDRNLRTDLFGTETSSEPPTLTRKRVSFDASGTSGVPRTNGAETTSTALVRTETDQTPDSPDENLPEDPLGLLYAERVRKAGGKINYRTGEITPATSNGTSSMGRPDMEQTRGNDLPIVPEDEAAHAESSNRALISKDLPKSQADKELGDYFMSPSMQELRNYSREQLKKVNGFTVGRKNGGRIEFSEVDLTDVPLGDLFGNIIKIERRSATVYHDRSDTPPRGKGLNVPSLITLENCWPRAQGGRTSVLERKGARFDKHIERLRRVVDTEFVSYDKNNGLWQFRVQHFTTYGLDDDDEDETEMGASMMETDEQTPKPDTAVTSQEMVQVSPDDASVMSEEESNPDDTFEFKRGPSKNLPGGFDDEPVYADMDMADDNDVQAEPSPEQHGSSMLEDPFTSSGSALAVQAEGRPTEEAIEQDLVGSFPEPAPAFGDNFSGSIMPKSILKTSNFWGTPKKDLALTGDWAEQLQRTVSPKKQDRQALRERQSVMGERPLNNNSNAPFAASLAGGKAFSTTMDIMNSLWAPAASTNRNKTTAGGKGFEWPYPKRSKSDDFSDLSEHDKAFHTSVKPSWTTDGTLVYAIAGDAPPPFGNMTTSKEPIVSEHKDIRFAKFSASKDVITQSLQLQLSQTLSSAGDIPSAHPSSDITFAAMSESLTGITSHAKYERAVWKLASILFDPLEVSCAELLKNLQVERSSAFEQRVRRDALSAFWTQSVEGSAAQHAKDAATSGEKALAYLTCNDIEKSCDVLMEGSNFRLATLVAQLPGDKKMKTMVNKQIESWRSQNVISEMDEPIRALYELIAGNVAVSEGKAGPVEDRASTFGISSHFGLDWRRSFGLRLWFGSGVDSVADAVRSYAQDVTSGKETVRPLPTSTEQTMVPSWDDPNPELREDMLFSLLKLYAYTAGWLPPTNATKLDFLLLPSSVSGNPLDARLSWQLAELLRSKRILSFDDLTDAEKDELTLTLATQLEVAGHLDEAFNVLLHISFDSAREQYIRDLLHRRASDLFGGLKNDQLPAFLVDNLHIPSVWIQRARALHARAVLADLPLSATFLLQSGANEEAHQVLCREVGPQAVVTQDYDALRELLGHFEDDTQHNAQPSGWRTGGQIYFDFIHLLDLEGRDADDVVRGEKKQILARLTTALPGVLEGRTGKVALEERVAVGEMAGIVRAECERVGREEKGIDRAKMERLPVSGDMYAKQGVDWSRAYYRAIAA